LSYEAPFSGIRAIDLTQGLAGPEAAMLLAQYGADVIKVEPPGGDWSRGQGEVFGDFTDKTVANNRGKRSIVLDLKSEGGKAVLRRLCADADVFLESFRPGVAERLGFGYDVLAAVNPRLVYLSISGFGQRGPFRERPATDGVMQAFSGLMHVNKEASDTAPRRVGFWLIDMATGLYAYQAIATALYARDRGGEPRGCHIDCSLMASAAALQAIRMIEYHKSGGAVPVAGGAPVGIYATADGHISVSVLNERDWPRFCAAIERPELAVDPRWATVAQRRAGDATLKAILTPLFAARTGAAWAERLTAERVLHEVVNDYIAFLDHPHVEASGAVSWIDHPDIGTVPIANIPGVAPVEAGSPRATAPRPGEHTAQILADAGYGDAEIAHLMDQGAVAGTRAEG